MPEVLLPLTLHGASNRSCACAWGDLYSPGSIDNDKSPGMGNIFQLSPNLFSLMGKASRNERLVGSSGLNTVTEASPILLHQ